MIRYLPLTLSYPLPHNRQATDDMGKLKWYIIIGLLIMVSSYPFFAFLLPSVHKCSLCRQSISFGVNAYTYLSLCAGALVIAFGAGMIYKSKIIHAIALYFISIIVVFLGNRFLMIVTLQDYGEYYALMLLSLTLALCIILYGLEVLYKAIRYFLKLFIQTYC